MDKCIHPSISIFKGKRIKCLFMFFPPRLAVAQHHTAGHMMLEHCTHLPSRFYRSIGPSKHIWPRSFQTSAASAPITAGSVETSAPGRIRKDSEGSEGRKLGDRWVQGFILTGPPSKAGAEAYALWLTCDDTKVGLNQLCWEMFLVRTAEFVWHYKRTLGRYVAIDETYDKAEYFLIPQTIFILYNHIKRISHGQADLLMMKSIQHCLMSSVKWHWNQFGIPCSASTSLGRFTCCIFSKSM